MISENLIAFYCDYKLININEKKMNNFMNKITT